MVHRAEYSDSRAAVDAVLGLLSAASWQFRVVYIWPASAESATETRNAEDFKDQADDFH
jgi:hypothetical protein